MPNDSTGLKAERDAIITLRKTYPDMPAKRLAKKIFSRDFGIYSDDFRTAHRSSFRPLLSIYSVIRRFDAKQSVTA